MAPGKGKNTIWNLRHYEQFLNHLRLVIRRGETRPGISFVFTDEYDTELGSEDNAGARRVLHPNTASRRKSKLHRDYATALAKARASA